MRLIAFTVGCAALAGCHPPDQAIYNESTNCVGLFDVALRQVRPDQFRKAGLFPDDIQRQALDTYEGLPQTAAKLGLNSQSVRRDIELAKAHARSTYTQGTDASTARLIGAVKECMPKPEGPND